MSWYVIRTATRREGEAMLSIRDAGFDCYLPQETSWRRHARKLDKVSRPLIPGYLFARLPDAEAVATAWTLHGVHSVLGTGNKGTPIRPLYVGFLAAMEGLGAFDNTPDRTPKLQVKPGERVKVTSGPFSGHIGEIMRVKGQSRAIVALRVFKGLMEVKTKHLAPVLEAA